MIKIGIITLNGYSNYGNRLQNYALQEVLSRLGCDVETILSKKNINKKTAIKWILKQPLKIKIEIISKKFNGKNIEKISKSRVEIFKSFTEKYLNETQFIINTDNVDLNKLNKYNFFVTGSDQVWNYTDPSISEFNFLNFTENEKKIAYAASFGVGTWNKEFKEKYSILLRDIKHISVREDDGAKIIKELTSRDAQVLVDPTMLLNKKEWLEIANKDENKPCEKYLLTYFLGDISKEHKKYINKIAEKNNLKIVNMGNVNISKYYTNGPSEFIDYINSAELFITDSFHGCVFSVLMETPFIVCDRVGQSEKEKMSSRIDTFVNKFKLENRKIENIKSTDIFICDYTEANKVLEIERKKSMIFLEKALNIENKGD